MSRLICSETTGHMLYGNDTKSACINPFHYRIPHPAGVVGLLASHSLVPRDLQVRGVVVGALDFCRDIRLAVATGVIPVPRDTFNISWHIDGPSGELATTTRPADKDEEEWRAAEAIVSLQAVRPCGNACVE